MWHKLLRDARFHPSLLEADRELARAARNKVCPACGGRLHERVRVPEILAGILPKPTAAFARKPRSGGGATSRV